MFTKRKFLSLDMRQQHKKCAELLRASFERLCREEPSSFGEYDAFLSWMKLLPFEYSTLKALADRYHWHLSAAGLCLKEHNLLPTIRKNDRNPTAGFLPAAIYLDNVRSAYNVGSILRTVEALRIGSVYFSEKVPFIDNEKVRRTAMGAADIVPVHRGVPLTILPRPLIVLDTSDEAIPISHYLFPKTFTLILGNEEYGVSDEALRIADHLVEIPLCGAKNSLNVACAFAIAAQEIRKCLPRS
jgi:tRNA G18 (ribose-2'-O)-methylase SpoU